MSYRGHRSSSGLFNHAYFPSFAAEDRALSCAAAERHQQLRAVRERRQIARPVAVGSPGVIVWARSRIWAPIAQRATS